VSYHIYTTKGIMLSYRPWREADRIYSILTRDLGLIRATAIGVRHEKSKLRGSLEPITLARVSLVKGKEFWRLTSAESLKKIEAKQEILKPLALLERLVQGEAHHPELFDAVEKFLSMGEVGEDFELRFVAHILHHLGYLKEADLTLEKKELITAINEGIGASHLTQA
jgi:DNA repair protein RecO (recombination protein O)